MPTDHEKRQPIEPRRDVSDGQKPTTSQKTANEAVSSDRQAKRHSENFESLSHDTKALGQHLKAEQPLVLHDSATGETLYDASKRRAKVSEQVQHKPAGEKIVEMERALQNRREGTDHHSSDLKIPSAAERPDGASRQVVREHNRSEARDAGGRIGGRGTEATHEGDKRRDTARGDAPGAIKQDTSLWIPDYKSLSSPTILPKLVEVRLKTSDNARIEELYRKSLGKRDESLVSDFEKQNLRNLAFCDVTLERYQEALTKNTLRETQHMPDQVRGLMLAGAALEDGAAIGASKAVLHKVILDGAIGDLTSGTAMGFAFGKVIGTLAANVNPWTRLGARALQAGGLALAVKEIGQVGVDGYNGLMKSLPALQECCAHPSEKNFARAKANVEDNLGDPLADGTLISLGFAAAHGIEKVATRGGVNRSGGHHEVSEKQSIDQAHGKLNEQFDKQRHKDVQLEIARQVHSDFACENKVEDFRRVLKCRGEELELIWQGGWFGTASSGSGSTDSPIKVHVLTDSLSDLVKVQRVLIPELMHDSVLKSRVGKWKGMDPKLSLTGETNSLVQAPTGTGQGAKAFTVYAANAEAAILIQRRIDAIMHEKGLSLKHEFNTGNTEVCPGLSKRVSICRDTFKYGRATNGHPGCVIDEPVASVIEARGGVEAGERLSSDQLRVLEAAVGIQPNLLDYSRSGQLMLKTTGTDWRPYHGDGFYATESGAGVKFGERTERPALYALYREFGFDPCDPNLVWKRNGGTE